MAEPALTDKYKEALGASRDTTFKPMVGRTETVTLAKRKWLIGMRWRSYEVTPKEIELVEEAEAMHADWIARRFGTEAVQVGYCPPQHDKWPDGIYSLAAMLADSHKVPWAGAFDLGDGLWWYIAVRDNYGMMPDGDVVGTYEEIEWARQEHASLEDFQHVDGNRVDLEKLIAYAERVKTKRTRIESLTAPRLSASTKLSLAIFALCTVTAIGCYVYYKHVQAQALISQRQQMQRMKAIKAQLDSMPNLGRLLSGQPDPAVWLRACGQAVYGRPLWDQGWQLVGEHCAGTKLFASWSRGPEATIAYMPAACVASVDGNSCTQTLPIPLPARLAGKEDAMPLQTARARMILWGQQHNVVITFSAETTPKPKSAVDRALGTDAPPPVASLRISFSVPAAPFALDFSGIPGLRLTDLKQGNATEKAADNAGDWTFTGVLYGR